VLGLFYKPQLPQVAISAAVIAGSLAWHLINWLRRPRSRLLRPAEPATVNSAFVGRETQVAELTDLVSYASLVWVTGESGSGKSWVITRGVLPNLHNRADFLPLYINEWGRIGSLTY
jgi:hypothetical protein